MEDPAHPNYPQNLLNVVGPRNMIHSWATDTDDATDQPRWGKIGKQRIEDAGTLYPKRMETVDNEIRDFAIDFIDRAKKDNKPFFVWLNPTRMHIVTHLSPKYEAMRNSENGWSEEEAGMAQLDDDVGLVMGRNRLAPRRVSGEGPRERPPPLHAAPPVERVRPPAAVCRKASSASAPPNATESPVRTCSTTPRRPTTVPHVGSGASHRRTTNVCVSEPPVAGSSTLDAVSSSRCIAR